MRRVRSRLEPPTVAGVSPGAQEEAQLDNRLQHQLEEDVARIFDESIYSDLEVLCGKLKVLTHNCILKARTNNFYKRLEFIFKDNIGQNSYDDIYSFISDAYTECDIKHQENEIIKYLDDKIIQKKTPLPSQEAEDYDQPCATPKCSIQKESNGDTLSLVHIGGQILDKELIEQDALSDAFKSFLRSKTNHTKTHTKPKTLSLISSLSSKPVDHASIFDDTLHKNNLNTEGEPANLNSHSNETATVVENSQEQAYSPDSLVTDEPSSSYDYLSTTYPLSPGASISAGIYHLNVSSSSSIIKMEDKCSLDSGLERSYPSDLFRSLSSNKDIPLTDVSLTESTFQDLTLDDTHDPTHGSTTDKNKRSTLKQSGRETSSGSSNVPVNKTCRSPGVNTTKEEKQRQNEEIHVMESSSISSETGSWESVFPPRRVEREICQMFLNGERQQTSDMGAAGVEQETQTTVQQFKFISPFVKTTACFIDASSLLDETEDNTIKIWPSDRSQIINTQIVEPPSEPLPCSKPKSDISPGEWSEGNENDDSLERTDNENINLNENKDLSPTIFDMTPITEDSLCTNAFEAAAHAEENKRNMEIEEQLIAEKDTKRSSEHEERSLCLTQQFVLASTPHNSILTIKTSATKSYESDESEYYSTNENIDCNNFKLKKYNESSPIVSGGASIEDHLPQMGNVSGSPMIRRKIENIPIVSGAYIPDVEQNNIRKVCKPSSAPAWVVDMCSSQCDVEQTMADIKKPGDKQCQTLKNESKINSLENGNRSRSSLDSDSSDKSSHKFYIDLSSLPDTLPAKSKETEPKEKKNIFSMYIGLDENSVVKKELPARLSSSLNARKNAGSDTPSLSARKTTESNSSSPNARKNAKSETSSLNASNKAASYTKYVLQNCKQGKKCSSANTQDLHPKPDRKGACAFEKYESLCDDPKMTISDILKVPAQMSITTGIMHPLQVDDRCRREFEQQALEIQVNGVGEVQEPENPFVRLSDLDRPIPRQETRNYTPGVRMTRSIPDDTWSDSSAAGGGRSADVISSFHSENAMSLNRLFPHLRDEFSRSMPGSLSSRNRSPLRPSDSGSPAFLDEPQFQSDASEASSAQSSMGASIVGYISTEENSQTTSLISHCRSRLGQDLLRMFVEEIAPDVVVEVGGRRIKAHKCILSSRCQYFAGILSGGWVESSGNVIVLPPRFSYNVVHFALCHIYSGVSVIPETISILELATLADMLGLEGLKEAIMFTLKAKYCHNFHEPCTVCVAGVLECFPLTSIYGLDDLYHRCLKWITNHFALVWATKAFATLPKDLIDKCFQQLVNTLSIETFMETIFGSALILLYVENSGRWSETVVRLSRRLVNAVAAFAAPRLNEVLQHVSAVPADAPPLAVAALRTCVTNAIEWAPPEVACLAYAYLYAFVDNMRRQSVSRPDLIRGQHRSSPPRNLLAVFACSFLMQLEGALVRAAPRVVTTPTFQGLPLMMRRRLRELGCIVYGGAQARPPSSSPVHDRRTNRAASASGATGRTTNATRPSAAAIDIDKVRAAFVPYALKPPTVAAAAAAAPRGTNQLGTEYQGANINPQTMRSSTEDHRNGERRQMKIRMTKAQEERTKYNLSKNNPSQEHLNKKVSPYENTKPRYLELRIAKDSAKKKRLVPNMTSSESSRNSSPVQRRQTRTSRSSVAAAAAAAARPCTGEPATDSRSDSQASNKYATYTKTSNIREQPQPAHPQVSLGAIRKTTKIPVYNETSKSNKHKQPKEKKRYDQATNGSTGDDSSNNSPRHRRGQSSLMSATKSSSAKMVPKIAKESKTSSYKRAPQQSKRVEKPDSPPIMERSGTFLKDEPTFGDRFDIDNETE